MSMKSRIHIHPYTLVSNTALNAQSQRYEHHGVLIRTSDEHGHGYGCIHPWPELGDAGLEQTLSMLAEGELTPLSQRALYCAGADAEARRQGISLFKDLVVPRSHATLTMGEKALSTAVDAGFDKVKLKVGRNVAEEANFICTQAGRYPDLLWRLDFNHALDYQGVNAFLSSLGEEVRDKIDFIEDAYSGGESPWVDALGPFGVPMAVDREVEDACGGFAVAVVKPAANESLPIMKSALEGSRRVVFTSYMDHPLGQCFAAWEAARAYRDFPDLIDTCGLVTHALFEPDAFSQALGLPGPDFHPPSGTGLGFDVLLENLSWKQLN